MDLKSGTLLVPPAVKNSSCSHPRYTSHNFLQHVGIAETIEAVLILILTLGVIGANALVIFVINNRRYSPYIHQQVSVRLVCICNSLVTFGFSVFFWDTGSRIQDPESRSSALRYVLSCAFFICFFF